MLFLRRSILGILAAGLFAAHAEEVDEATRKQIEEALKAFEAKKYDEVLEKAKGLTLAGDSAAFLANLEGAAHTKLKDYKSAEAAFQRAIKFSPGMFAAHFNRAEILFLQRDFEAAETKFSAMLDADPRNELLQFKVVMCRLQAGDKEGAQRTLSRMVFPGTTPAWYFAKAAWEHAAGNRRKASGYLESARQIFPGQTSLYEENFADVGLPRR